MTNPLPSSSSSKTDSLGKMLEKRPEPQPKNTPQRVKKVDATFQALKSLGEMKGSLGEIRKDCEAWSNMHASMSSIAKLANYDIEFRPGEKDPVMNSYDDKGNVEQVRLNREAIATSKGNGSSDLTEILKQFAKTMIGTTASPPPAAPPIEVPVELQRKLVQGNMERILSTTKTALDSQAAFPPTSAFFPFTIKEIWTFALIQMFTVVVDEAHSKHVPEKELTDRIVAFGRALRSNNIKALEKCFEKFDSEKKANVTVILKSMTYLTTKHAGDLSKKLSEFYPDVQTAASVEETKLLGHMLIALQQKLVEKLVPAFKIIGDEMQRRVEVTNKLLKSVAQVAPHLEKAQQVAFFGGIDLSIDLTRFRRLFSIYTSLRQDKVKNATRQVAECQSDETLVAPLAAFNSLNENLTSTKNPYADRFIDYLNALSDVICLSSGMQYDTPRVDKKFRELMKMTTEKIANHIFELSEIIDDALPLAELRAISQEVLEDIRRSHGESIKKKKAGAAKNPKYELIKGSIEKTLESISKADMAIKSSGYVHLEAVLRRGNKHTDKSMATKLSDIYKLSPPDASGSGSSSSPASTSPITAKEWLDKMATVFDNIEEDELEVIKKSSMQAFRDNQTNIFGNSAQAAVESTNTIDDLQSLIESTEDIQSCDFLLGQLAPFFNQCHTYVLERVPPETVVDFDWFYEAEEPRTAKPQKNSGESSSSRGKTASEPVAEAVAPAAVQPKMEVPADDTDLDPPVAMFIAARKALLSGSGRNLKKTDPNQIYHADAAYHLFHLVTLLDMIARGGTEQLRLFIPELMNATTLVQEQLITPKYVEAANPETVTHDLRKMSDALGIKTPFIFNFGSQGFRYPNSLTALHARFHRPTPKWVEEMIALDDQQEFASDSYLTKTMERVKIGLHFAVEMVGSNELTAISSKVDEHLKEIRYKGKSGEVKAAPMFEKLLGLLDEIDKNVVAKNESKITVAWKDLKVHALRLERAEKSLRQHKDQQYLSLHAKSIVMSAQYFIEHCGTLTALAVDGESLHTHRLSDYAALYDWETQLSKKQIETLKALDIEKGADYPTWALYNGRESAALELLSSAYEVAMTAAENGEGFQSAEKGSHAPDQVRSALEAFVVDAVDLVTALAALTKSRL